MNSTPTPVPAPPPFDSRALGELVLSRLAEIEHLSSEKRYAEIEAEQRRRPYTQLSHENDKTRVRELSQHLDMYARLADTAARTEHNDVLAAQQSRTRRRTDNDEY